MGYVFLVALGIAVLLLPVALYAFLVPDLDAAVNIWFFLGLIGSFTIGVGLFNFVSIIIRQYLGHWVSILSFLIGGIMVAISLHFL